MRSGILGWLLLLGVTALGRSFVLGWTCGLGLRLQAQNRSPSTLQKRALIADAVVGSDVQDKERADEAELLFNKDDLSAMPEGTPKGFVVVKQFAIRETTCQDWESIGLNNEDMERVDLQPNNISLPVALMLADSEEFPSVSRARKACRKGNIIIHSGKPASYDEETGLAVSFDLEKCKRGRVGDRVFPGDIVGKQVRMGSGYFPAMSYKQPPFELPVILEDDHFAVVNKPAGVVVYNQRNGGHGIMTVRAALPFVLQPPRAGTYFVLRRPASVHRLDKPTSGVLCVAKTKPAMVALSRQFHDRVVQKTYMAVVNGIPEEKPEASISSRQAFDLGVDTDPESRTMWQLVDSPLDEKSAVTVWRAVRYVKSLHAHDGYLTLVELKPKTGRYHQLRRHMAWECKRPLVGDAEYDGGTFEAMKYRERGLFLCSSRVILEHPFYNSDEGRSIWESLDNEAKFQGGKLHLSPDNNRVMVQIEIDLPDKFQNLLTREEERYHKFVSDETES